MEIRIKLKISGVPSAGPENLLCDKNGAVKNTSIPESTLYKNHNATNYHCVRGASAAGIICAGKEDMATNLNEPLKSFLSY